MWHAAGRRTVRAVALAAALLMAVPAVATASPGSHARGDAQGTGRQVADGPATAGLAWRTDLGMRLENEPNGSFLASNGLAIFQGRDVADDRGKLVAIDPSDGSVAWGGPAVDVAWSCPGVATSDGRVIVQLDPSSPTHSSPDASLVAISAATGDRITGELYNGEDTDGDRLRVCSGHDRLVLAEAQGLVLVVTQADDGRVVRAIDIDSWTEAWQVNLVDVDGASAPPTAAPVVLSTDGVGFYVIYRWDADAPVAEQTWRLERFSLADGSSDGFVDVPGSTYVGSTATTTLAADSGVVFRLTSCSGAPASAEDDDCLIMYDDDGGDFTERWRTFTPAGANRLALSLALMDADTVGGFGQTGTLAGTQGLSGFDLDTGAVEWSTGTPFSNNGQQFITDPSGNGYFGGFGEYHVRSVSPDGVIRWGIEHCHLTDGIEPAIVGPIGTDGTLVTMARNQDNTSEVFRGFRTGATLPKGECPEEQERVAGVTRVETSVEIANLSHAVAADTVVIATATNYPDALAGGPLARKLDAPLLLTDPLSLSPETRAEIERLGASRAVLLGGTVALSSAVQSELVSMGLDVDRIAGQTRFETARLISQRVPATTVYVTEGANADPNRGWPDAVAVSGLASFEQRPILLVSRDEAPADTLEALDDLGATEAVIVGGEAAVSAATQATIAARGVDVTREAGTTRYGTSVEVAKRSAAAGATTLELWFATGLSFPDALAAGPAVAKAGGILMLVHGLEPTFGEEVHEYLRGLDDGQTARATFVGGVNAVTDAVAAALLSSAGIQP